MRIIKLSALFLTTVLFWNCSKQDEKIIVVKNDLDIDRSFETVELTKELLHLNDLDSLENFTINDAETQRPMIVQYIDNDGDGLADVILFQPAVPALSEKKYELINSPKNLETDSLPTCYSRFVPERTDDYAWENNRVAFRTYGPTAQKMIEDNIPGGTLSSGIDAWLKKVEYPIINKWYEKTVTGKGSYHEDTGEGLDNFHVGPSRGVGGIAVKVDSLYYISKNFSSWKTIANGPIRTSFILTYNDWDAAGNKISEEKHISLDYGSNLSKFEIHIKGADTISVGLTLHENDGQTDADLKKGWLSYWEPHGDSELGTGIVVPANSLTGEEKYVTDKKDLSNLYAHLKVDKNRVVYYAGFGWRESGQFKTKEEWESYLSLFAKKLNNPLKVEVK